MKISHGKCIGCGAEMALGPIKTQTVSAPTSGRLNPSGYKVKEGKSSKK